MKRQPFIRVLVISVTALSLTLAACATRPPDPKPICIAVKEYTKAEQQALAAALAPLPVDSIVLKVVMDYGQLRDGLRACAASH